MNWLRLKKQMESDLVRVVANASTRPAPSLVVQYGPISAELVITSPGQPDRVLYDSDAAFLRSIGVAP